MYVMCALQLKILSNHAYALSCFSIDDKISKYCRAAQEEKKERMGVCLKKTISAEERGNASHASHQ
jgi:hypothetical protein